MMVEISSIFRDIPIDFSHISLAIFFLGSPTILPGIHLRPRHNGPDASLGGLHDIIIPSSRKAIGHDRRPSRGSWGHPDWCRCEMAGSWKGHEYFSGYGWRTMPKWLVNGLIQFIPFMTQLQMGLWGLSNNGNQLLAGMTKKKPVTGYSITYLSMLFSGEWPWLTPIQEHVFLAW